MRQDCDQTGKSAGNAGKKTQNWGNFVGSKKGRNLKYSQGNAKQRSALELWKSKDASFLKWEGARDPAKEKL